MIELTSKNAHKKNGIYKNDMIDFVCKLISPDSATDAQES